MSMITDDMMNELFTRLRETEAQTREQQVRLDALAEKMDAQSERIAGFTTITGQFITETQARDKRSEEREKNFWKVIYILIGSVVALSVGPKVAKEIITAATGTQIPVASYFQPIAPMQTNDHFFSGGQGSANTKG